MQSARLDASELPVFSNQRGCARCGARYERTRLIRGRGVSAASFSRSSSGSKRRWVVPSCHSALVHEGGAAGADNGQLILSAKGALDTRRGHGAAPSPRSGAPQRLTYLHERVLRAESARNQSEPRLLADRLDHQDGVRVLERDARGVAAGLEGAPDVVSQRALDGGRVEAALESAALEADEEGPAGEAGHEGRGGGGERPDGGRGPQADRAA